MSKRKIIKIDEDKCNGCGLCIPNCKEGALQIVNGKARLVSDVFCDGLGACLGHCPQDAITIEEREAQDFDEKKAMEHVHHSHHAGGCPGSKMMDFRGKAAASSGSSKQRGLESQLRQWPIQINLVPPRAPYLDGADLLIAADCVPFAYADFHEDLLKGRTLLVGCPKLDDIGFYEEKIGQILKDNDIKSVTYAHMEVPCCFGLIGVIKAAIDKAEKMIPFHDVTIKITGEREK